MAGVLRVEGRLLYSSGMMHIDEYSNAIFLFVRWSYNELRMCCIVNGIL